MDLILETADNFKKLFNVRYDFILGIKDKCFNISIIFRAIDFHHLAGFQYISDISQLKACREKIYFKICTDTNFRNEIYNSKFYNQIEERLNLLKNIELFFDEDNILFKYSNKRNIYSKIDADFLIQSKGNTYDTIYIFGSYTDYKNGKRSDVENTDVYCKSIFLKDKMDYTINQEKITILKKSKIEISTQKIIYSKTNPHYVPKQIK